jgi:hypothetical protein
LFQHSFWVQHIFHILSNPTLFLAVHIVVSVVLTDYDQLQQCDCRCGFLQMDSAMMMEKHGLMDVASVIVILGQKCVILSLVQCQPAQILSSICRVTAVLIVQVMHT